MSQPGPQLPSVLGQGRSARVYRCVGPSGPIARKTFIGSTSSRVTHWFFTGTANPYNWCQHAIDAATARRWVLTDLVFYWFGDRLSVAEVLGTHWDQDALAFAMDVQLIEGRHAALRHPFSSPTDDELRDLAWNIMRPLQQHLAEAGFDGMVWQAGRGCPPALGNFMLQRDPQDQRESIRRWVWIDLESGVPALAPINPVDLFTYYLPMSFKHGRALFDDIDLIRLRDYLKAHAARIEDCLGSARTERFWQQVALLESSHIRWKSMRRHERGIEWRLRRGQITQEQADRCQFHPVRWHLRQWLPLLWTLPAAACRQLWAACKLRQRRRARHRSHGLGQIVFNPTWRRRIGHAHLRCRLHHWLGRHQLSDHEADQLLRASHTPHASFALQMIAAHQVLRGPALLLSLLLASLMLLAGSPALYCLLPLVLTGPLARLLLSLACVGKHPTHHTAGVFFSCLPLVGTSAYALELLRSREEGLPQLGSFILYDKAARLGQAFPIWGGENTLIEHIANHLPDFIVPPRDPLPQRVSDAQPDSRASPEPGHEAANLVQHQA